MGRHIWENTRWRKTFYCVRTMCSCSDKWNFFITLFPTFSPNHQVTVKKASIFVPINLRILKLRERAHFPPILNKFIYYFNKISEFCPQNLLAKSWQNFGTLEFRYFVEVVNKHSKSVGNVPFLVQISEYRDFSDPLVVWSSLKRVPLLL